MVCVVSGESKLLRVRKVEQTQGFDVVKLPDRTEIIPSHARLKLLLYPITEEINGTPKLGYC